MVYLQKINNTNINLTLSHHYVNKKRQFSQTVKDDLQ